jgi:hypothetical protein
MAELIHIRKSLKSNISGQFTRTVERRTLLNLTNTQKIFCPFLAYSTEIPAPRQQCLLHLTLFIWSRLRDLICSGGAVTVHNVLYTAVT